MNKESSYSSSSSDRSSSLMRNRQLSTQSTTLVIGLLCFVVQFWNDLRQSSGREIVGRDRKNSGVSPSSYQTLRSRVLRIDFVRSWILTLLLWVEKRITSARRQLTAGGADPSPDPPVSPSRPLVKEDTRFPSSPPSFLKKNLSLAPMCSPILPREKHLASVSSSGEMTTRAWKLADQVDLDDHGQLIKKGKSEDEKTEEDDTRASLQSVPSVTRIPHDPRKANEDEQNSTNSFCGNWKLIQSVLTYWFGQDRPEKSQRQLWMIAEQTAAKRSTVDAAVWERFGDLFLDLAQNRRNRWSDWSGCPWSDGDSKFQLELAVENQFDGVQQESNRRDLYDYGYQGKIAAIVVLDQLSRHILRHLRQQALQTSEEPFPSPCSKSQLPQQSLLDSLAYRTSRALLQHHASELNSGMIPTPMYIFSLMPFRHAKTIPSVQQVQDEILKIDDLVRDSEAMARRFRTATNRQLCVLQDEGRRVGNQHEPVSGQHTDSAIAAIFSDEDLLECPAFSADMAPSHGHVVHQTIRSFLTSRGILSPSSSRVMPIIISLSGGVDSMVIASILSHLARSCQYQLKLIAVHIDYGNRPESAAEADFVRRFCRELGNIDFRCRRIDEVTRGVTARDEYEKISRTVRYDMYRQAVQHAREALIGASEGDPVEIGVVLGHHRGDLRENVLSNAHRGCGPLELSGMTAVSRNDGMTLYRPLLPLEKPTIFDYAHRFGVPYFKDTTPHWSTRGKLRNKLLPLLQEIYGEGSMSNLSNLAVESDACRNLLHSIAFGPFLDQITKKPMGITFATNPWKSYDVFFWKIVLREALHSVGLGMFSEKSIVSLLERVRAPKVREGWLQCRKDYGVYLRCDGQVFVLFPKSFPWDKSAQYVLESDTVAIAQSRSVGPWRVSTSIQEFTGDVEKETLLARKAVSDMDSFMKGCIEYYVEARTWTSESGRGGHIPETFVPRPLVFAPFTKATRPLAWKNADIKLQATLPLLSCDPLSRSALKDPVGCSAVHTDETGTVRENPVVLVKITLKLIASEACPMLNA